MFEEYTRIAFIINASRCVESRSKLQKMVYIAQVLGYPFREDYILYLYGPYSEELAGELQRMKELNLLDERELDSSCTIELTENGKALLDYFLNNITKEVGNENVNRMKNLFRVLSKYDPWKLEIVATLFYFYHIGYCDMNELRKAVKRAKPKFSPDEIDNMTRDVQSFIEKYATQ